MKRTTALEINTNLERIGAASNWILITVLDPKDDAKENIVKYCDLIIEKANTIKQIVR